MPDAFFDVAVVTPEVRLVEGQAEAVVFASSLGDLTILDQHTPLVSDIVPGELRVKLPHGETVFLAVHGGFIQVETGFIAKDSLSESATESLEAPSPNSPGSKTRVTVLAGVAELARDIDVPRAQVAKEQLSAQIADLLASGAKSPQTHDSSEESNLPSDADLLLVEAEAGLRRCEVRLAVAQRNK